MRSRSGFVVLAVVGCLGISGCSQGSNTAEMPTKVVPRPVDGLKVDPSPAPGPGPNPTSQGQSVAPDPGSP